MKVSTSEKIKFYLYVCAFCFMAFRFLERMGVDRWDSPEQGLRVLFGALWATMAYSTWYYQWGQKVVEEDEEDYSEHLID